MNRNFKHKYRDDDEDVDENGVVKDGGVVRTRRFMIVDGKPVTRDGRMLDEKALAALDSDAAAQAMRDVADAAQAHEDAARERWLERQKRRATA